LLARNHKRLAIVMLVGIMLFSGIVGCESSPQGDTGAGVKEVDIYTFLTGTSVYAIGVGMQELINEQSDWLRATAVEGRSAVSNIEMLLREEDARKNTIIWANPADLWELREGVGPFEQKSNDIRPFISNALIGQHIFTMDPNIKSLSDLEGKTVAIGPGHMATRVTFVKKLIEAAGVKNVRYENLDLAAQMQALADGQVDATVANIYFLDLNPFEFQFGSECLETLAVHTVYAIPIPEEIYDKAFSEMGGTWPTVKMRLEPYQLLETQDEPIFITAFPSTFSAHVDIDPEIVKEFMRIYFDNLDKFAEYHPVNVYINEKTAALLTLDDEFIHPAGLDFMKERGYSYYKNIENIDW